MAGPGHHLKAIFARLGARPEDIETNPAQRCGSCEEMAAKMDRWGPEKCRRRLERIVRDIIARATLLEYTHARIPGVVRACVIWAIRRSERDLRKSDRELG